MTAFRLKTAFGGADREPVCTNCRNNPRAGQVIRATPPWADQEKIAAVYAECQRVAASTGIPMNVDHAIPINSDLVCGLHVLGNLQIITKTANRAKGNKFAVDGGN